MRFWRARTSDDHAEGLDPFAVDPTVAGADGGLGLLETGRPASAASGGPARVAPAGRVRAFFRIHFMDFAPAPAAGVGPGSPPAAGDAQLTRVEPGETPLSQAVRELVSVLGPTPGALASSLEVAGVRGRPGDPGTSPVARYLSAVIGADPNVKALRVEPGSVVVDLRAWWRPPVTVPLPDAARAFAAAFDAGCYPSLVLHDDGGAPEKGAPGGRAGPARGPGTASYTSGQG